MFLGDNTVLKYYACNWHAFVKAGRLVISEFSKREGSLCGIIVLKYDICDWWAFANPQSMDDQERAGWQGDALRDSRETVRDILV